MAGVATRRMFERSDVVEMLQEGLSIVAELDPPADLRADVFKIAMQVVGQREIVPSAVQVGGGGLLPRHHH